MTGAQNQPVVQVDYVLCSDELKIIVPLSALPQEPVDLRFPLVNWAWGVGNIQCGQVLSSEGSALSGLEVEEYSYNYAVSDPNFIAGYLSYPAFSAHVLDGLGNLVSVGVLVPTNAPNLVINATNCPTYGGTNSGGGGAYSDSLVSVTAIPNPGYSFSCWCQNGLIMTFLSNYTFTATSTCTLVANFTTNYYTVATTNSPSDGGVTTGDTNAAYGTTITVSAKASLGYAFANWTEDGAVMDASYQSSNYTFILNSNTDLVANYSPLGSSILATIASPSSAGLTSGGGLYTNGQSETLTATVTDPCYTFVNWTMNGVPAGTSTNYVLIINTNQVFTANFAPFSYNIALSATAGGVVSGGGSYACGTAVTFHATPNLCYSFLNWTENGSPISGLSSFLFVVNTNHNFVANFIAVTNNVMTSCFPIIGGAATGGGLFGCQAGVTVTAIATNGYTFRDWTENGTIVSTSPGCSFTSYGNMSLVANFVPNLPVIGLGSPLRQAGNVDLLLQGPIGSNYEVDASTDLFNWLAATNFISTSSPFYFIVPMPTNVNQQFYRAVMQ